MIEEAKKQVHELYESIMDKPNQILQYFQDFFGEARVDMQGFPSEDELYEDLSSRSLGSFISWSGIRASSVYKSMSKEDRELIETLWVAENADIKVITDNPVLIKYFLPILKEKITNVRFNNLFILIYFPIVRITNEYDKYIDIRELWVKVPFDWNGRGKGYFGINRSNYPLNQFKHGYMHSHVYSIPRDNFEKFQTPCTGRGPINSSLSTLAVCYDDAIWQLLCLEIDRYVKTESIKGVPYHKLENIPPPNSNNTIISKFSNKFIRGYTHYNSSFRREQLEPFIRHLLETKKIKFNYGNGSYGLGMSFIDTVILISNEFINWYNTEYDKHTINIDYARLLGNNIIKECIIINNRIYIPKQGVRDTYDFQRYVGSKICTFKGRDITLTIDEPSKLEEEFLNKTRILSLDYIEAIIYGILRVLNYEYRREERSETSTGVGSQTRYI